MAAQEVEAQPMVLLSEMVELPLGQIQMLVEMELQHLMVEQIEVAAVEVQPQQEQQGELLEMVVKV
jgi:hypothetical protein